MSDTLKIGVDCLENAFDSPAQMLQRAKRTIPASVQFDTVIGCGLSGALVVPILASSLDKKYAIVRKPEDRHKHRCGDHVQEWSTIEGEIGHRWLFVDDGISSGSTFAHTAARIDEVAKKANWDTLVVGGYFYGRSVWMTVGDITTHLRDVFASIWS